jgi:hypothetical protein
VVVKSIILPGAAAAQGAGASNPFSGSRGGFPGGSSSSGMRGR